MEANTIIECQEYLRLTKTKMTRNALKLVIKHGLELYGSGFNYVLKQDGERLSLLGVTKKKANLMQDWKDTKKILELLGYKVIEDYDENLELIEIQVYWRFKNG